MKIKAILVTILLVLGSYQLAFSESGCNSLKPTLKYTITTKKNIAKKLLVVWNEEESANNQFTVFLKQRNKCIPVLYSQGSTVQFKKSEKSKFPDIEVSWHMGANDNPMAGYYVWDGKEYESQELIKSKALNKEALQLYHKGKIQEAIKIWKKATDLAIIPGLGYSANDEALNNLGFAYFQLAKKTGKDEYFIKADEYLSDTIEVNYKRWVAYLNLGDLYFEEGDNENAIENYKKLLKLKPNYKYGNKIRQRIQKLKK